MSTLTITLDDAAVRAAFAAVIQAGLKPSPLLKGVGELLLGSTKERFAHGVGPDGQRWAPNAESTLSSLLNKYKGSRTGRGRLSKRGAQRAASKKPLIGETRQLSTQIVYDVSGKRLTVGSPMVQAAVQQFGARKGQFGRAKKGAPIPWGDIPARPFLGLSLRDRAEIDALAREYLATAVKPAR